MTTWLPFRRTTANPGASSARIVLLPEMRGRLRGTSPNVDGRDQRGAKRFEREFLQMEFRRLPQIGEGILRERAFDTMGARGAGAGGGR